jgi:hypothetical protein
MCHPTLAYNGIAERECTHWLQALGIPDGKKKPPAAAVAAVPTWF